MVWFFCVHIAQKRCAIQTLYRVHICAFLFHGETASDPHIIPSPCTTKDFELSLKWEPLCAVVTLLCVTLPSLWSHSSVSLPHMEQALLPSFRQQYLRVGVWSGSVDYQWCSFAFLSLPSQRRKYNWEISRALLLLLKVICIHTVFPHKSSA